MNYRERFYNTINHKNVDRAPFDLNGTPMTLVLDDSLLYNIASLLKVKGENKDDIWEGILKELDIDFRRVGHMPTPESALSKRYSATKYTDYWGVEYTLVGNDYQITKNPLRGATVEDLKSFPWPNASKIDKKEILAIKEKAKRLYNDTPYVIVGEHPVYGILELGCWMCGFDEFLLNLALEPEFVEFFFNKVYEYQKNVSELYYGEIGEYIHLTTSGDDFGTQKAPFMSPDMFSELIAPYYDERIKLTNSLTDAVFFHHTCGSVKKLIPRMIESGVKILNPIQPGAADMEPDLLKNEFGCKLTFWGGIDTQHVLPEGNKEDVRKHVNEVLSVFKNDGGYVFSPAHCLQKDVPAENVIEMFKAAKEFYGK